MEELPYELWLHIFLAILGYEENSSKYIVNFALVCKKFRDITKEKMVRDHLLKWTISEDIKKMLYFDVYKINPLKTLTIYKKRYEQHKYVPLHEFDMNTATIIVNNYESVGSQMKDICHLRNINYMAISFSNIRFIPKEISLIKLVDLHLTHDKIENINHLGLCSTLQNIDLKFNNIRYISKNLGALTNLIILDLSYNSITHLPKLDTLYNLKFLVLTSNKLSTFPLSNLNALEILEISLNRFSNLSDIIENAPNLRRLTASQNIITDIPQKISTLKKLTHLGLNHNKLVRLPDSIIYTKKLYKLSLIGNRITCLPKNIGEMKKLERLLLDHNQLEKIPDDIWNAPKLREVSLEYNSIKELPPYSNGNLETLCIKGNPVEGFIQPQLRKFLKFKFMPSRLSFY